METLTMEQAIAKGYTHFMEEEGEYVKKFSSIKDDDREYYKTSKCYIMDMKTPLHYTIDSDTIKELISEHVAEQDMVADEDDKLYLIASSHDYSELAKELNEKFKKHEYFEPMDIQVTF